MSKELISNVPEYYWRDYLGVIPNDAVQGGADLSGIPTYIAQGYFDGHGVVPGTIEKNCGIKLFASFDSRILETEKCIKILCCSDDRKLRWIKTTDNDMFMLASKRPVLCGAIYKYNFSLYLGRGLYGGRTIVGCINYDDHFKKGLHLMCGKTSAILPTFEMLIYSPKLNLNN